MDWKWVKIESDSFTLINILKEESQIGYGSKTVIEDIRFFCKLFDKCEWHHIGRETNMVAHKMVAKDLGRGHTTRI